MARRGGLLTDSARDGADGRECVTVSVQDRLGTVVKEFQVRKGMNLWFQLRKHGLPIGAACSGVGVCAACDVEICSPEGSFTIDNESEFERSSKQRQGIDLSRRLSCLVRVWCDLIVKLDTV